MIGGSFPFGPIGCRDPIPIGGSSSLQASGGSPLVEASERILAQTNKSIKTHSQDVV